jgi:hypothetical protein
MAISTSLSASPAYEERERRRATVLKAVVSAREVLEARS